MNCSKYQGIRPRRDKSDIYAQSDSRKLLREPTDQALHILNYTKNNPKYFKKSVAFHSHGPYFPILIHDHSDISQRKTKLNRYYFAGFNLTSEGQFLQ